MSHGLYYGAYVALPQWIMFEKCLKVSKSLVSVLLRVAVLTTVTLYVNIINQLDYLRSNITAQPNASGSRLVVCFLLWFSASHLRHILHGYITDTGLPKKQPRRIWVNVSHTYSRVLNITTIKRQVHIISNGWYSVRQGYFRAIILLSIPPLKIASSITWYLKKKRILQVIYLVPEPNTQYMFCLSALRWIEDQ